MELEAKQKQGQARQRNVVPCNFRSAGLLSNESTRQLRSMHDALARNLSHSLDLFLGAPMDLKLAGVEQLGAREFLAGVAAGSYVVPIALPPGQDRVLAKFDSGLLFPLLDVLLGGSGDASSPPRELTEIDEELFRSVTELMCAQLDKVWKGCGISTTPQASLKPVMIATMFGAEDRVVTLQFDIRLAGTESGFTLVLPSTLASALVRGQHGDSAGRGSAPGDAMASLEERLLDCAMLLTVDLPAARVPLSELVELRPGGILNLRAAAHTPIRLRVGNEDLFDVTPARSGVYKAAELIAATI